MCLRHAASLIVLVSLWGGGGQVAMARSGDDAAQQRSVVTLPLQDLPPADTLYDRIGRVWDGFTGMFSFGSESARPVRAGGDVLQAQLQQRDDFVTLMEAAGFGLREIETSIGLIPSSRMTFGLARELTDADRDNVERMMERHARRHAGPLSRVQRSIVGSVLSASEFGDFAVERVEIDLYPLPQIRLALVPRDAPMSMEAGRIMRSIDRLGDRLQSPPSLHGETEWPTRRREAPLRAVGMQISH